ncbi:MAG TPA: DNA polymerase Y family protein [Polyangia bacterium]
MRLACVHVPQLALQAALRRSPELRGTPVALCEAPLGRDGRPGRARVTMVSAEARRAGVRVGLTSAQAAAVCPGLTLCPRTAADAEAAEAALADLGFAFASHVEREPGRVFFEIGDLGQLYPSEAAIAQVIQQRAVRVGLGVRVAIAERKGTARVATRARERVIVPPGGDSGFLAPLALGVLGEPLPAETTATFGRWGIALVGAFAALPAADVGLRLGAAGARLHRVARGEDDEPFLPTLPPDAVEEGLALDDAIAELEPLAFVLRGLCDRLLSRLACRGLACVGITLRLQLETRTFDVREVNLAAPTRDVGPLLQLARLELTRKPPDAPIIGLLIVARPARARGAQLDFLRPAGPAPDRLAATIARLAALVGPENVGAPRSEDTWREEAVGVAPYALIGGARRDPSPTMADAPTIAMRRFRPPEEIEVMLGPEGPAALRGRATTARVTVAAGPYRLSGEWWRRDEQGESGFSRDYWDVHASDGALYRLHHDRLCDRWFLDGYYD